MQDAIGMVNTFEIVIDLGAERAASERMRRVAVELPGGTVLHFDAPVAGVRAVVATCATNDVHRGVRAHRAMVPSSAGGVAYSESTSSATNVMAVGCRGVSLVWSTVNMIDEASRSSCIETIFVVTPPP